MNYEGTEQRALQRLPAHAQELLKDFFRTRRISVYTRLQYIKAMRSYVQAVQTPLQETCNQNLTRWYNSLEDKEPNTTLLYGIKLKALYAFHLQQQGLTREESYLQARKLFINVPFRQLQREADRRNKLRDKIVTPKEFQQLLSASNHPRLTAYIVTQQEAACRPGELCGTRIRDLQFHERYATIRVCGKTGERTIPVINSIPYLRAWLSVHPDKHNPDAPLFAVVYKGKIKFPDPLAISQAFRRLRHRSNIHRRVYAYMLRHTRLTDLAERNMGEYAMKSLAGWTIDSKMAKKYIHISGRTALKAVLEIEGIALPGREKKPDFIKTKTCPRCNAENEGNAQYCSQCSLVLDEAILHAKQQKEIETDRLMDLIMQHPTVQQAVKDAVKELWTQGSIQKSKRN